MKILWFWEKNGVEDYNRELHSDRLWNFLFWNGQEGEDDLLIAGDGGYDHPGRASHNALADRVRDRWTGGRLPTRKPDGAGNVSDRQFISWSSTGFGVNTPKDLRPIIAAALGVTE